MGKKAKKQANKLGFRELPLTVLYAQPKSIVEKHTKLDTAVNIISGVAELFGGSGASAGTHIPDIADVIQDYCLKILKESEFRFDVSGSRSKECYLLAKNSQLYVEIVDKMKGIWQTRASNHLTQINIYSENKQHAKDIANLINKIHKEGVIENTNWEEIEKKFNVSKKECIYTWEELLADK
jgi:hypothetical protein